MDIELTQVFSFLMMVIWHKSKISIIYGSWGSGLTYSLDGQLQ
ncbi:MAG TPA: hypothetical protein VK184_01845 [Nostocaceae cyanobacterium]|nr:hypothetical protein [Nostocaceae cyanobacterium]